MRDRGHAAVELALGAGLMLLPAAIVVLAFGPWAEHRVTAEAIAAEAARIAVIELDVTAGNVGLGAHAADAGIDPARIRVGWCGASSDRGVLRRLRFHTWERGLGHGRSVEPAGPDSLGTYWRNLGFRDSHRADRSVSEPGVRRSERGSITIWMLGLSLLILVFGGLALDYWRALALQRELASIADSAAIAAASGIDETVYRASGAIVLDPQRSMSLANDAVAWQGVDLLSTTVDVTAGSVTVTLVGEVELGLLGVFVDQSEPLTVRAQATAIPVLLP